MKLIVRNILPTGNYSTKMIEIDEDSEDPLATLQLKIEQKFKIPKGK